MFLLFSNTNRVETDLGDHHVLLISGVESSKLNCNVELLGW